MNPEREILSPREGALRSLVPLLFVLTTLGAFLVLVIALSSAVAQAGSAGRSASDLAAPNTLHWREITPVTSNLLDDVDMLSGSNGWSVGISGTVLHYNGSTWTPVSFPSATRLVDVQMRTATDGFIVSRDNNSVYRWDGTQWTLFYTADRNLNRLSLTSGDDVWVVGIGKIYHCNPCPASGGTWTVSYTDPVGANIFNIQMFIGSQGVEGWAGGASTGINEGALLVHYLNGVWTRYLPSPSSNVLYDSFFTVPTDGWAIGYTATTYIVHYDGVQWTRAYTPTQFLDHLSMLSPTEGWMSGPFGDIVHYVNGNFITQYTASDYLTSIDMLSQTDGWAVGNSGVMAHYEDDGTPSPTATSGAATSTSTATRTATSTSTSAVNSPTASPTSQAVTATATAAVTATACTLTFTDVPPESAFYAYIRCLACRGIISGYGDGSFRPGNEITRGQIAKMVSNAAGFTEDPGPQIYEDVDPATNAFYQWINRLSNRGFIGGYPCGTIDPEPCVPPDNRPYFRTFANTTRGQLSKIVANAAGVGGTPTGLYYTDVPEDNPFYLWIMRLTNLGVMSGYDCGGPGEPCDDQQRPYFRPFANVTRGQASKIVANTFFPDCQTPSHR